MCKYYGSKGKLTSLTDVVVTTPHTKPPPGSLMTTCTRLILDESHLYEHKADPKLPPGKIMNDYKPRFIWCVTGTPFTTTLSGLQQQATFLGQWDGGLKLRELAAFQQSRSYASKTEPPCIQLDYYGAPTRSLNNFECVRILQKLFIRHTKAQRINGEAALSLPDADVETVWLEMSRDEKALYQLHECADGRRDTIEREPLFCLVPR